MGAPPQPQVNKLALILNDVRKELLDLGLRNPLLNYRLLKSRGLEVVDERPSDIYRILVAEGKRFSFLPLEDQLGSGASLLGPADDESGDNSTDLDLSAEDPERRFTDTYLQTSLSSKQLQTRLLATYYAARTSIEEQGVNTLFLALGMLRWHEADSSEETHQAPLILIPVELERTNVKERFRLKYGGEELGSNASLAEFLRQSFSLKFPELPETEDLDLAGYFDAVEKAISGQPTWSIDSRAVVLGFFSFSKFLMYRDLDPATWPEGKTLLEQSLLNDLLGAGTLAGNGSTYGDSDFVDNHLADRKGFQVVDADSSQTVALLDVANGHHMVIQGPPGTGKSQTIVNAIAEALAAGKRILFVSEKMAALDVVKRRLDAAGLGPACLELHSNKTNKKTVIEELKRTSQIRYSQVSGESDLAALEATRRRLNEYCQAVNLPVGKSSEAPCSLYGRLLPIQTRLAKLAAPQLDLLESAEWSDGDLRRKRESVSRLQIRLGRCGVPLLHPFWGSRLQLFMPTQRERVRQLLISGSDAEQKLSLASEQIATLVKIPAPASPSEALIARETCRALLSSPRFTGVDPRSPEWTARAPDIRAALVSGRRLREIRDRWNSALDSGAWDEDISVLRKDLAEIGPRWWRFFSGRWRSAKRDISRLLKNPAPNLDAMLQATGAIFEASQIKTSLAPIAPILAALFGRAWRYDDSDWDLLIAQFDWIQTTNEAIAKGEVAAWCFDAVQRDIDRTTLGQCASALELASGKEERIRTEIVKALDLDFGNISSPLDQRPLSDIRAGWDAMASRIDELDTLVGYNQAADECRAESLNSVVQVANGWENAATFLLDLFDQAQISSLLELAFRERPPLATFDGPQQSDTVERFRRLDVRQLELNRSIVAREHGRRLPSGNTGDGQIGILWREFEKKGRFLPLRKLMAKAGNVIQAIKPVFMMSPLSIANFVPPGALEFDLVIFDEASQVRPADALGAIVRGRQIVVVGDSKQLPPTSFFDTLISQEPDSDEEESATSDIESVLGLLCSRGAHQRMLRWHYRSRHESLIAVSNHLFYDDRLIVFPSPDRERRQLGLLYHRLQDAPYDRSRTRTNPEEARTVAEAVIAHARAELRKPEKHRLTLGVAAFSVAQMDAILSQIEALRRQNASCEEFFESRSYEPFFVKNLENVQGDERDVMFISVGYGRTVEGYLAMSFGPLNRAGGERRLNVLITRARQRCEVFTTLSADDIDLTRTNSTGVSALKTFLTYASTGRMEVPVRTDLPQDSVFEEQVLQALRQRGYTVHPQVGCAGFFLDLAVVDDGRPGRYVLGIECDGAAYHSARSARDRDRLRQAVLEGLNWEIHRIWSTDWFRNPGRELGKVVEVIERAKGRPEQGAKRSLKSGDLPAMKPLESLRPETPSAPIQEHPNSNAIPKYSIAELDIRLGSKDLHLIGIGQLARWLATVVAVESPVFWLEAVRRIVAAAGVQRAGSRIQDAFQKACEAGSRSGLFLVRDRFLWRMDMTEAALRDHSDLPQAAKKIEYVAPEEIQMAIQRVAQDSYGVPTDDVANGACRLLGFARVTDEMRSVVEKQRDVLIAAGRLVLRGDCLVCAEESRWPV